LGVEVVGVLDEPQPAATRTVPVRTIAATRVWFLGRNSRIGARALRRSRPPEPYFGFGPLWRQSPGS
jgi:hypothetical protein